jgi:uncharacterized protein
MNNILKFGLDEETLETITNCIKVFPEIEQAIIFGSRAMGNFKPASDIDLALKGKLKNTTASSLWSMLDNAPRFPYKIDVLNYETLSNIELKKHIDEEGKLLFARDI